MDKVSIDRKTTAIILPPSIIFLVTLLIVHFSRSNVQFLSQMKLRINDPVTRNFLEYFSNYEEFLNFIVPEEEVDYLCSGNFYTNRNYIDAISTEDGNGLLRTSGTQPDIISNEEVRSFIEIILGAILENRDDSMSHFISCDLFSLSINIDSYNYLRLEGNDASSTSLSIDMLKEIYDYLENFSITNYNSSLRGTANIAIRFEYQSREDTEENWPNNIPQIVIDVESWTHGFVLPLADLELPYRDRILGEIITKVSRLNNSLE